MAPWGRTSSEKVGLLLKAIKFAVVRYASRETNTGSSGHTEELWTQKIHKAGLRSMGLIIQWAGSLPIFFPTPCCITLQIATPYAQSVPLNPEGIKQWSQPQRQFSLQETSGHVWRHLDFDQDWGRDCHWPPRWWPGKRLLMLQCTGEPPTPTQEDLVLNSDRTGTEDQWQSNR